MDKYLQTEVTSERLVFRILGEEFAIKGNTNNKEKIQKVVSYIEEVITGLEKENSRLTKLQKAIFASLRIADELEKLRAENHLLEELIKETR